ncbi:hypothetical protein [Amycolatopsis pigmentata]|uniref:Uncharacterized protein n=1 Tax=Amycolatopsis pigmentata TaxID=450801 RepID=A0ABW5G393_9PSEU
MWRQLKRLFTGRTPAQEQGQEADVQHDPAEATTRATGGESRPGTSADAHSTTGPSANDTFVGRVAGEDSGDAGETGAERRARS